MVSVCLSKSKVLIYLFLSLFLPSNLLINQYICICFKNSEYYSKETLYQLPQLLKLMNSYGSIYLFRPILTTTTTTTTAPTTQACKMVIHEKCRMVPKTECKEVKFYLFL